MTDQCHLKKLREGVNAWNMWRLEHPEITPDLRDADLQGAALAQINFDRVNLDRANLCQASLKSASLKAASLFQTNLNGAKLHSARLYRTCFRETLLQQTNLYQAYLLETLFQNVDLSTVINPETVYHLGPSTIGIDTLQRSRGKISRPFLVNAGVSEQFLTCISSLGQSPFTYSTCFISHSTKDKRFVERLYQDLRNAGVHCWYAPDCLETGAKFPGEITEAVQSQEKVLIVFSKNALGSDWVRREAELARQREGNGKRLVLLPIRIDDAVTTTSVNWAVAICQKRISRILRTGNNLPIIRKCLPSCSKTFERRRAISETH